MFQKIFQNVEDLKQQQSIKPGLFLLALLLALSFEAFVKSTKKKTLKF